MPNDNWSMMKIADWLKDNTAKLKASDISTARLDCLVLLEDQTGRDRVWLLANADFELSEPQLKVLDKQLERRLTHLPLAFIRGKTEFYGRDFIINDHVLEPRPESETIIEQLKKLPIPTSIIDVGTGSGALAITAKLEVPTANLHAIDIDANCLAVVEDNSKKYDVTIHIYKGDLLEPIKSADLAGAVVLANLPYVPDDYQINRAATKEPRLAIFGGQDGLNLYRKMFDQIDQNGSRPAYILAESLPFQHADLRQIALAHGFSETIEDDFIQVFTD